MAFAPVTLPVPASPPLVDIHCHLLPGIDDGPSDWDQSLAMARVAVAEGIATVIAAPHQLGNYCQNQGSEIRRLTGQLQLLLNQHEIPLRVLPGAEVRIEPDLVHKVLAGEVLSLAGSSRYVLLELPREVYLPLDGPLQELDRAGLVGILSHPERNLGILGRPQVVESLVDAGCLMQATAGSLVGTFGPQVQAAVEQMLTRGLIHFLATDAHGAKSRRPLMRRSFDRVTQLVGLDAAHELCYHNPARVVANVPVQKGRRPVRRTTLARWFAPRKAG